MKRILLPQIMIMFLGIQMATGSPEIKPTADSCVVVFRLSNNEDIPYPSRTIIFNNKINGERNIAVTDSLGKALFLLPKNVNFGIDVIDGAVQVASYEIETPDKKGLIRFLYDVKLDIFEESREGEIFKTDFFSNTEEIEPTDSSTRVLVSLTNKSKEPIAGASVLFRNEISREVYVGQTNDSGNFQILLPVEHEYGVRLVDQGNRIPFTGISTKLGTGKHTLTLDLTYDFTEESSYDELFWHEKNQQPDEEKQPDVFVLSNVLFDFDKSTLKQPSLSSLNAIVKNLKSRKFLLLEISGHTDSIGTDEYNLNLSERRARSVMNYFTEMGIDPKRMCSVGMGASLPIASNGTAEGRQQNRRTEIHVIN